MFHRHLNYAQDIVQFLVFKEKSHVKTTDVQFLSPSMSESSDDEDVNVLTAVWFYFKGSVTLQCALMLLYVVSLTFELNCWTKFSSDDLSSQ